MTLLDNPIANSTDEEKHWALMLLIDEDDVARAEAYWRRHANPIFAGLLDHDGFAFNEESQRYIRANRRAVSDEELRWIYLSFLASASDEMEVEAGKMFSGETTLEDWVGMQARAIKDEYIASAAVGVGGTANLTEQDLNDVRGTVGESGLADAFDRLQKFEKQIENEDPTAISEPQITSRAGAYARPAYEIYQGGRRASHIRAKDPEAGKPLFTVEMNVLGPAEKHCRSSQMKWGWTTGCIECTEAGWVAIGSLPPIGARTCSYGCLCHLAFAIEPPESDH